MKMIDDPNLMLKMQKPHQQKHALEKATVHNSTFSMFLKP